MFAEIPEDSEIFALLAIFALLTLLVLASLIWTVNFFETVNLFLSVNFNVNEYLPLFVGFPESFALVPENDSFKPFGRVPDLTHLYGAVPLLTFIVPE